MNAPSSHGVAAAPLSQSASVPNRESASLPVTRCTVARRVAGILDAVRRFFTDPVEFPDSVYGLLLMRCRVCRDAVHRDDEMCPKSWAALCDVCGPVLTDYFGNCMTPRSKQRTHHVGRRHAATLAEWQSLRKVRP